MRLLHIDCIVPGLSVSVLVDPGQRGGGVTAVVGGLLEPIEGGPLRIERDAVRPMLRLKRDIGDHERHQT